MFNCQDREGVGVSGNLLASIDLGTNTARLLIASVENGVLTRHHVMRRITRLGGGFTRKHGISPEACARTLAAMEEFASAISSHHVMHVKGVATSAVRDAVNGEAFRNEIRNATGIELETISGELEGELTLKGVISGLDTLHDLMMVFDVGGGSTEYTLAKNGKILFTRSLPLGVVRLTEGKQSVDAMTEKIDRELGKLILEMRSEGAEKHLEGATLIGTAGTATTLAAISQNLVDYDYHRINNLVIPLDKIHEIFSRLLPLSPRERIEQVAGLEKGREDLIIAGTLLTVRSMELLGIPSLKVSDFGLLEGVLMSLADSLNPSVKAF